VTIGQSGVGTQSTDGFVTMAYAMLVGIALVYLRIVILCALLLVVIGALVVLAVIGRAPDERTIAHNLACEQYLADRLTRRGLEPVLLCRTCAGRGVRRAGTVGACLDHYFAPYGPWPSTLDLAGELYRTITMADFTPLAWPPAYARL
jgi:hypothetical protein